MATPPSPAVWPAQPVASGAPTARGHHGTSDNVYEALRLRIMDHEIAPNARININRVATVLDVSQTPVREALARLESEGLVDREALRGYRAAPLLNRRALDELFSFRLLIEPWAAAKARMNQTPTTGDALVDEIGIGRQSRPGPFSVSASFSAHDSRFHDLIAAMSENRWVRDAFQGTHCHLHIARIMNRVDVENIAITLEEHELIAKEIIGGTAKGARGAMTVHLEAARDRTIAAYEAFQESRPRASRP